MLDGLLSHPGNYTLFAPTNEAFAFLPPKTLDRYLNVTWKEHLQDLLYYHLLGEIVFSPQLMNEQTLTTLNGETIFITKPALEVNPRINSEASILVNEGLVDIPATNGIIHTIDDVLLPFSATWDIIEIAEKMENCSKFVDLVECAGLTDYLKDLSNSPVTVFGKCIPLICFYIAILSMKCLIYEKDEMSFLIIFLPSLDRFASPHQQSPQMLPLKSSLVPIMEPLMNSNLSFSITSSRETTGTAHASTTTSTSSPLPTKHFMLLSIRQEESMLVKMPT